MESTHDAWFNYKSKNEAEKRGKDMYCVLFFFKSWHVYNIRDIVSYEYHYDAVSRNRRCWCSLILALYDADVGSDFFSSCVSQILSLCCYIYICLVWLSKRGLCVQVLVDTTYTCVHACACTRVSLGSRVILRIGCEELRLGAHAAEIARVFSPLSSDTCLISSAVITVRVAYVHRHCVAAGVVLFLTSHKNTKGNEENESSISLSRYARSVTCTHTHRQTDTHTYTHTPQKMNYWIDDKAYEANRHRFVDAIMKWTDDATRRRAYLA